LDNLLEKHPNLMADISNLEPPILRLVLERVSPDRLIFGSDALYVPIWKAWVRFLQTLQLLSKHPDDDLIRIASLNPAYCLSLSATC
jgi:predicted TIM-barrel fold metal-dependent hydrolase